MRLPNSFQYKGHTWKVTIEKNLFHSDGTKCAGLCDTETREIYIEAKLSRKEKLSAFYHELFHVIVHEAHVPADTPFTEGVEDIMAEAFADLLETTFKLGLRK